MEMSLVGWLVIGFLAGSISGLLVGDRSARGCLPTISLGVLGGLIGGWLSQQLGMGQVEGFIGAVVFATLGAASVRLVLRAVEGRR